MTSSERRFPELLLKKRRPPAVLSRYRPKGVFGKGIGNSKNASEMRRKCVKMGLVFVGKEIRWGEHFWTIPTEGEGKSGHALKASNALNYRAWGIPAALSRGIPGNALSAWFRNSFPRWTLRIYFIFVLLWGGEGEVRGAGKGRNDFLIENPRGGSPGRGGEAGQGVGRVFARNLGGGGV